MGWQTTPLAGRVKFGSQADFDRELNP
jgi:hypothetical protein